MCKTPRGFVRDYDVDYFFECVIPRIGVCMLVLYNRCKRAKGFVRISVRIARHGEADEDYN